MIDTRPPENNRPLGESIGFRIASFIRSFTTVLYASMGMALVGLAMKYFATAGGSFVFVFAMAMLVLLFLVQVGISFLYVISNVRIALLGAISSVALVLGFIALLFRFQDWVGWEVMLFIALPLYMLTAVFITMLLIKHRNLKKTHKKFLHRNLVLPYVFLIALSMLSLVAGINEFNQRDAGNLHESPLQTEANTDTTGMWRAY